MIAIFSRNRLPVKYQMGSMNIVNSVHSNKQFYRFISSTSTINDLATLRIEQVLLGTKVARNHISYDVPLGSHTFDGVTERRTTERRMPPGKKLEVEQL